MKKSSDIIKHFISEIVIWKNTYNDFCILHFKEEFGMGPISLSYSRPNKYILYKINNYEN